MLQKKLRIYPFLRKERKMSLDTLEKRFWYNGDPPIVGFLCGKIPKHAFDDVKKTRLYTDTNEEILKQMLLSPLDAVYTDMKNREIVEGILSMGIPVYMPERMSGLKCWTVKRNGIRLYTAGGTPKSILLESAKRGLDLIAAVFGISAALLLLLPVTVMIEAEDPGSVFYSQWRVGYNGRKFRIYKFRTMYKNADEQKQDLMEKNEGSKFLFKISDDPRITKTGKILRKYNIDELPQFFNVLKGEMSVVGTRPPLVQEMDVYQPRHKRRLTGKPGITGVWQVYGDGERSDFDKVVRMDRSYIRKGTIREYISLVLSTMFGRFGKGE